MLVLICGASGAIGSALVEHYLRQDAFVACISHRPSDQFAGRLVANAAFDWLNNPDQLSDWLARLSADHGKPDVVISCTGFLHDGERGPEKKLADLNAAFFADNMTLNCYSHIALCQALAPLYERADSLVFAALSAKVGSISDNQLGGWYSYRMSKAALNMFIKTLSIEWRRTLPRATAVAIHPGTTDSALSKPFQARLAADKLYSPALTAERIASVCAELDPTRSGELLFWDGSRLDY